MIYRDLTYNNQSIDSPTNGYAAWNVATETAQQVSGFFVGAGKVVGETVEGTYGLVKNIARTGSDILGGHSVDLADLANKKMTGKAMVHPECLPNRQRGNESLEKGGLILKGLAENPKVLWDAVADPIHEDWNTGRYGEAIGRGTAEIAGVFLGTKGADKLGVAVKVTKVADRLEIPIAGSRIEQRVAENVKLRELPQFQSDMGKVGITDKQLNQMWTKETPLGFQGKEQFVQFKSELHAALKQAELDDAKVGLKGTSTTFYSENPSKPLGHHWDANPSAKGDYDLNVTSQTMVNKFKQADVSPSEKYGVYKTRDMEANFPHLDAFQKEWSSTLERDVNFVGYPEPRPRDATEFILKGK